MTYLTCYQTEFSVAIKQKEISIIEACSITMTLIKSKPTNKQLFFKGTANKMLCKQNDNKQLNNSFT